MINKQTNKQTNNEHNNQHLTTHQQQVRIKCRDFIKRVSVYKDRLAVQLPDRISIWELHRSSGHHHKHGGVPGVGDGASSSMMSASALVGAARHGGSGSPTGKSEGGHGQCTGISTSNQYP